MTRLEEFWSAWWEQVGGRDPVELRRVCKLVGVSEGLAAVPLKEMGFLERKALVGYLACEMLDDLKAMIRAGLL